MFVAGLPVIASAAGDEAPEYRAVLEIVPSRQRRGVALHALADRLAGRDIEAGNLALVTDERRDLPIDRVGHVDADVRLVHAPVPQLTGFVGVQPVPRERRRGGQGGAPEGM